MGEKINNKRVQLKVLDKSKLVNNRIPKEEEKHFYTRE